MWYVVHNTLPIVDLVTPSPDHRSATYWVQHTTSCSVQLNAPEDRQNCCPKHVELIWFINKPLLLHLVGFLLYHQKAAYSRRCLNLRFPNSTLLEGFSTFFSTKNCLEWGLCGFQILSSPIRGHCGRGGVRDSRFYTHKCFKEPSTVMLSPWKL